MHIGVAIPHVSPKDIYPLLISYPTDKDEQQYIVKTLDAVAEMIKLRKETIQLTKDLNHPKLWHDFIDYVLYDYNNLTALWEEIKEYNKLKYYC